MGLEIHVPHIIAGAESKAKHLLFILQMHFKQKVYPRKSTRNHLLDNREPDQRCVSEAHLTDLEQLVAPNWYLPRSMLVKSDQLIADSYSKFVSQKLV